MGGLCFSLFPPWALRSVTRDAQHTRCVCGASPSHPQNLGIDIIFNNIQRQVYFSWSNIRRILGADLSHHTCRVDKSHRNGCQIATPSACGSYLFHYIRTRDTQLCGFGSHVSSATGRASVQYYSVSGNFLAVSAPLKARSTSEKEMSKQIRPL